MAVIIIVRPVLQVAQPALSLSRRWADAGAGQAWVANRAHGRQQRGGHPEVSRQNMRALQALLLICPCGALVQYSAALRAAKACQREEVTPGDGCADPAHKMKPRNVARFTATQKRWATDTAAGRPVVAWPATRTQYLLQVISPLTGWESE